MAVFSHALTGESNISNVTRSKIAPKRAPGGTVFHQGAIAAKDNPDPRMLRISHESRWKIAANPAETSVKAESSQTTPQIRPMVECICSLGEIMEGLALNPSGGLPAKANAPPRFASPCKMSGIATRKRIIVDLHALDRIIRSTRRVKVLFDRFLPHNVASARRIV